MRINLSVPFSQKDAVKTLGARWDPARKIWYIVNVRDLTPFLPWISHKRLDKAVAQRIAEEPKLKKKLEKEELSVTTGPNEVTRFCVCDVPPWELCPHT